VDLEVVPRWHVFTYLCILLGCFRDALHINMGNESSCDANIELKGNVASNINGNASILAYLQV
jgi:hypothetical protein